MNYASTKIYVDNVIFVDVGVYDIEWKCNQIYTKSN
jgi:hypothetical protein